MVTFSKDHSIKAFGKDIPDFQKVESIFHEEFFKKYPELAKTFDANKSTMFLTATKVKVTGDHVSRANIFSQILCSLLINKTE